MKWEDAAQMWVAPFAWNRSYTKWGERGEHNTPCSLLLDCGCDVNNFPFSNVSAIIDYNLELLIETHPSFLKLLWMEYFITKTGKDLDRGTTRMTMRLQDTG